MLRFRKKSQNPWFSRVLWAGHIFAVFLGEQKTLKKKDKIDYAVVVVLNKTLGDKVTKGDILGTIYYNKKVEDMGELLLKCYQIDKKKKSNKKIIIKTIK